MSKKKVDDGSLDYTLLFGRPGNGVKMGILGMPNVGKSLTFNVLSDLNVPSENFPFCTIDPNIAQVKVPDERYTYLVDNYHPKSNEQWASLKITDIAGLVKGAAEGKGLGNAFLSHVSAVDGLFHVCRAFKDKEVEHVEGDVDAVRDLEIINDELRARDLATLETVQYNLTKGLRAAKTQKGTMGKKLEAEQACLDKMKQALVDKVYPRTMKWTLAEVDILNEWLLLTLKPQTILINIRLKDFENLSNPWIAPVMKLAKEKYPDCPCIPYSAQWESEHAKKSPEEKATYLEAHPKIKSMMDKIIHTGYSSLGLIHYFTCGVAEVKCWTIRRGVKAPGAAGVIHSDFENNFILAEVMHYNEFVEHQSEAACKAAGKYHTKGKEYTVQDGDIMVFKHGAKSK
jgi:obg-like ATPase 1